ncbi:MAG: TRAP transporter small permease [Burkholderiales bacterium]|nr:TRAP transporter small permease [Burkholderiales bacterium]
MAEAKPEKRGWARFDDLARRIIEGWALLGGVLLVVIALMNTWSVISLAVLGYPVPGDFELVKMGVAIVAFSFLPYCQLKGANVTADIFTAGASKVTVAVFTLLAALVAAFFSILLLWKMSNGMVSYLRYREVTTILNIPQWTAYPPILASLVLLVLAAGVTLNEAIMEMRPGRPASPDPN